MLTCTLVTCLLSCVSLVTGNVTLAARLNNVTKLERQTAKMECQVSGSLGAGRGRFFWFKDGVNITALTGPAAKNRMFKENFLLITDVRRTDSGLYRCVVELHGSVADASAYLDVQCELQCTVRVTVAANRALVLEFSENSVWKSAILLSEVSNFRSSFRTPSEKLQVTSKVSFDSS